MANEHHHHGSSSVAEAAKATANWRAYLEASNNEFNLQSFWISIDKIKSLLEHNPDADGVRVYMGLNDAADPTSFKIVTVTTKHKQDVVEGRHGELIMDPPPIYCPPICPMGGVLNG